MSRFRPFEFNDGEDRPEHKWLAGFMKLAGLLIGLAVVGAFLYELARGIAGK